MTQVDAVCRRREVALGQQCVEHDEKVQIKAFETHASSVRNVVACHRDHCVRSRTVQLRGVVSDPPPTRVEDVLVVFMPIARQMSEWPTCTTVDRIGPER
ncbi:hypothetical protein EN860_021490 [Mesorhizobium sp. M00.F.Ca.ET.217.01.1.1]|nr:hypothetical protein EN860_021490 [Mesorhizobium sp. M00.F.Ca.ET.217.01.1.1]TGV90153.1 hypothetical protein EN801_019815 [Mesorhizobium sp. M00.F.Ca.ET.158.01.1.1]